MDGGEGGTAGAGTLKDGDMDEDWGGGDDGNWDQDGDGDGDGCEDGDGDDEVEGRCRRSWPMTTNEDSVLDNAHTTSKHMFTVLAMKRSPHERFISIQRYFPHCGVCGRTVHCSAAIVG
jgi:hypothetical protein